MEGQQESAAGSPVLTVIAWIWVAIAAIIALAAAADGKGVAAFLFVASAAVVAPPLRTTFAGMRLDRPARVGIAAVGALAGVTAIGMSEAAEAPATAAASPDVPTAGAEASKDTPAEAYSDAQKADLQRLWTEVLEIAGRCDRPNSATGEAAGQFASGEASVYEIYGLARTAQRACAAAQTSLAKLSTPSSLPEPHRSKVAETLQKCEGAYAIRKVALDTLMTVLDGDQRPSQVQRYKEQAEGAQAGVLLCVTGFIETGILMDVELPEARS
ncbi:MAG: hypothetical protein ACK4K7_06780 [Allosphingosinicella sp.]|uniref:hypothetical protein n=1 Tax=Allosphingosinicella sp. TaxID=2823234 RepID=UPI003940D366